MLEKLGAYRAQEILCATDTLTNHYCATIGSDHVISVRYT